MFQLEGSILKSIDGMLQLLVTLATLLTLATLAFEKVKLTG